MFVVRRRRWAFNNVRGVQWEGAVWSAHWPELGGEWGVSENRARKIQLLRDMPRTRQNSSGVFDMPRERSHEKP